MKGALSYDCQREKKRHGKVISRAVRQPPRLQHYPSHYYEFQKSMTLNMCVYCVCATLSKINLDNGHHDIPIETSSEPNVIRQFETISIFHYHYEFITFLIGVSYNGVTPKSSSFIRFSIINYKPSILGYSH